MTCDITSMIDTISISPLSALCTVHEVQYISRIISTTLVCQKGKRKATTDRCWEVRQLANFIKFGSSHRKFKSFLVWQRHRKLERSEETPLNATTTGDVIHEIMPQCCSRFVQVKVAEVYGIRRHVTPVDANIETQSPKIKLLMISMTSKSGRMCRCRQGHAALCCINLCWLEKIQLITSQRNRLHVLREHLWTRLLRQLASIVLWKEDLQGIFPPTLLTLFYQCLPSHRYEILIIVFPSTAWSDIVTKSWHNYLSFKRITDNDKRSN